MPEPERTAGQGGVPAGERLVHAPDPRGETSGVPVAALPEPAPAPVKEEPMDLRRALREPLEALKRLKLEVWCGLFVLGSVAYDVATGDTRWKLLGWACLSMVFIARAALDGGIFRNPPDEGEDDDEDDGWDKGPLIDTGRPELPPLVRGILAVAGLVIVALSFLPTVGLAGLFVPVLLVGGFFLYLGVAGGGTVWEPEPTPPHPAWLQRGATPSALDGGDASPPRASAGPADETDAAGAPLQDRAVRPPAEPAPAPRPGAG